MIVIGPTYKGSGRWRGAFCRMTSDEGVGELLDFAAAVGVKTVWLQHDRIWRDPHFEITLGTRDRALKRGAVRVTATEYHKAQRQLLARELGRAAVKNVRP